MVQRYLGTEVPDSVPVDLYFNLLLAFVYSILPRSAMLVEVVVTLCLYYLRSYYPSLGGGLGRAEVLGNREVQLAAVNLLHRLTVQLIALVRDNGRPFALYIAGRAGDISDEEAP